MQIICGWFRTDSEKRKTGGGETLDLLIKSENGSL